MNLDLEENLVALLDKLGVKASVEFPGYLHIDLHDGAVMAVGTADGFWGFDITRDGVNIPVDGKTSDMWEWFATKTRETTSMDDLAAVIQATVAAFYIQDANLVIG